MGRKYEHVQVLYPKVKALREAGRTYKEIAVELYLRDGEVVRELIRRERRKETKGAPKQRGRKPAKTLQEWIPCLSNQICTLRYP